MRWLSNIQLSTSAGLAVLAAANSIAVAGGESGIFWGSAVRVLVIVPVSTMPPGSVPRLTGVAAAVAVSTQGDGPFATSVPFIMSKLIRSA